MKMKLTHVIAALMLVFTGFGSAAQAEANGYTTNFVSFNGGSFERSYSGEWLEFGTGNQEPSYHWRVTHQDAWSIYFRDDSRQMNMQIDMYRDWIRLEWDGHPMQDQYAILEADERINGRFVTQVRHDGGTFRLTRPGLWQEFDIYGQASYSFRETGRDAWSVYLHDDSRNMGMQIDVHRNWIRLAWQDHPMADQYRITASN
jgi:hypothetical protein